MCPIYYIYTTYGCSPPLLCVNAHSLLQWSIILIPGAKKKTTLPSLRCDYEPTLCSSGVSCTYRSDWLRCTHMISPLFLPLLPVGVAYPLTLCARLGLHPQIMGHCVRLHEVEYPQGCRVYCTGWQPCNDAPLARDSEYKQDRQRVQCKQMGFSFRIVLSWWMSFVQMCALCLCDVEGYTLVILLIEWKIPFLINQRSFLELSSDSFVFSVNVVISGAGIFSCLSVMDLTETDTSRLILF